jgi:hypothetical protein
LQWRSPEENTFDSLLISQELNDCIDGSSCHVVVQRDDDFAEDGKCLVSNGRDEAWILPRTRRTAAAVRLTADRSEPDFKCSLSGSNTSMAGG